LLSLAGADAAKSVLIKHIVGLLEPDSGYVKVEGKIVSDLSQKDLYELRKKFGFLFQGSALFDSMTVEENVSLPLVESNERFSKTEVKKLQKKNLSLLVSKVFWILSRQSFPVE